MKPGKNCGQARVSGSPGASWKKCRLAARLLLRPGWSDRDLRLAQALADDPLIWRSRELFLEHGRDIVSIAPKKLRTTMAQIFIDHPHVPLARRDARKGMMGRRGLTRATSGGIIPL